MSLLIDTHVKFEQKTLCDYFDIKGCFHVVLFPTLCWKHRSSNDESFTAVRDNIDPPLFEKGHKHKASLSLSFLDGCNHLYNNFIGKKNNNFMDFWHDEITPTQGMFCNQKNMFVLMMMFWFKQAYFVSIILINGNLFSSNKGKFKILTAGTNREGSPKV